MISLAAVFAGVCQKDLEFAWGKYLTDCVPFPARQTPNEYGASSQTESSWPDALSEAYTRYILSFMEVEQQKQEAILAAFLDQSEQH